MTDLGTIITAMVTPFDGTGSLNLAEAGRLAAWLADRGNDGLVVAGSTGEGMALDSHERNQLIRAVKEATAGRAAVIANVGATDARAAIENAEEAQAAGADGLLVVVPPYVKPTQSGMIAYFGTIADATALPIMIYNIPGRTAANMLPETLLEIAQRHDNIAGVKESSGDLKQIATIVRDRGPGFKVWAGDDHLFLPALSVGADGVVGVASHLCSSDYRRIFEAYRAGNVTEAAQIHRSLLALIDALFATTSPIAIKWAMNQAGFDAGACRLPLDGLPAALQERLRPIVASYLATA